MQRRPYRDEADVELLQTFNARAAAATDGRGYLHPGDIPHRLFNGNKHYDPSDCMTIWEDGDGVAAWTLVSARFRGFDAQVRPDLRGGELEREVLRHAEARTVRLMRRYEIGGDRIIADAFRDDADRAAALVDLGWTRAAGPPWVLNRIALADAAEPELPAGYTIRCAAGVEDAARLAEVHRGSFGVAWTPELYRKVMTSPGYAPEREFVAVAPDGAFAAFTVTWHDRLNRVGLFEPVGTHEDHRRRGLGRALLLTAMRHLAAAGMERAIVVNEGANEASRALYLSAGFEPYRLLDDYEKPFAG